jgi:hypothetical protein
MVLKLTKSQKEILQSYGRSFLGAALALYMAGNTDAYTYLYAFVAAFAPVAIRYFNKNDIAFGKISGNATSEEVATEVVKAVKKAAAKKTEKK